MRPWRSPVLLLLCGAALVGCGSDESDSGSPPIIQPLTDQVAAVNAEFVLEIEASDADGDAIQFGFTSDIPDIATRAALLPGNNTAMFRWTPNAADMGIRSFDFTATDGKFETRATISIEVKAASGAETAPTFRQPLGTGTTIDTSITKCLGIEVVVEDPDSPEVELGQADPVIPGATLDQLSPMTGQWNWCPSKDQIAAGDRYVLNLSARDEQTEVLKNFLVVLRRQMKPGCAGEAPRVEHSPSDESTMGEIAVYADVSDDLGIKYEPLLYYSTDAPSDPPDLAKMTQTTMFLLDGDMRAGTWGAELPNPAASLQPGASAQLYYVIVAQDNDDAAGDCDHLTQAPETGTFVAKVTNPGGSGGLGLCKTCSSDAQCGGPDDNCLYMGNSGGSHCFRACSSDADCPEAGYYCSVAQFESVDGAKARQCIPSTYSCEQAPPPGCVDDAFEENDSLDAVRTAQKLPAVVQNSLTICPNTAGGSDEDWYRIQLTHEGNLNVALSGSSASDLDLALYGADGVLIAKSDSLTSEESLSKCLLAGDYFLRVSAWGNAKNPYSLSYSVYETQCGGTCGDDDFENDDNASQARVVELQAADSVFVSETNAICPWDEDWYQVELYSGETLYVSLAFLQSNAKEDLDLILYKGAQNLTPCDEQLIDGCSNNGQSTDSDETMVWNVTETGTYYVAVRGYDGSSNIYDICFALQSGKCPF